MYSITPCHGQKRHPGGQIYVPTDAEKNAFRKAAAPLKKWYTDKYGAEGVALLIEYEKAIKQAEAKLAAELKTNL